MYWLRLIYARLYGLLRKERIEQEMDEELRFHLRMRTRENIERGMRPEEAEREARRRFGNVGHIKDLGRDIKGGGLMETLLQDLRYGLRMLLKHKGFTTVAVLTLALGIGANTAIFSVVNAVLLRSLPFKEPDRLVQVWGTNLKRGWGRSAVSVRDYVAWRSQANTLKQIAAFRHWTFNLTGEGDAEQIPANYVTGSLFATLNVSPMLGRTFLPAEEQPGANRVVVISYVSGLTTSWTKKAHDIVDSLIGQRLTTSWTDLTKAL
jgi:putative ABC transport system permease protein